VRHLGEGFSVSPTTGSAGVTNVVVTYRWTIPTPSNGFFRFRTTTSGVYVEVPVVVNVNEGCGYVDWRSELWSRPTGKFGRGKYSCVGTATLSMVPAVAIHPLGSR
jgi:hypothetical protein